MADRYCTLATGGAGTWTSTAIWSTALGGSGGASVPTANDVAIFPRSVTVNSVTTPFYGGLTVQNQSLVKLIGATTGSYAYPRHWTIDGTLDITMGRCVWHNSGIIMADDSHLIVRATDVAANTPGLTFRTHADFFFGKDCTVEVPGGSVYINPVTDGPNVIPKAKYLSDVYLFYEPTTSTTYNLHFGPGDYEFTNLIISGTTTRAPGIGGPFVLKGGSATVKAENLTFFRSNLGHLLTMAPENMQMEITGNIITDMTNAGPFLFSPNGEPWKLKGSANQSIDMPAESLDIIAFDASQKVSGDVSFINAGSKCRFGSGVNRNWTIESTATIKAITP